MPPFTGNSNKASTEVRNTESEMPEGVESIAVGSRKHRNSEKQVMETGVSSQYRPDHVDEKMLKVKISPNEMTS